MRVNKVANNVPSVPTGRPKGRPIGVTKYRTTKEGRDRFARFLLFLSSGASLSSALRQLGISRETHERWITKGIEGDNDCEWYAEQVAGAASEALGKAEIRVWQTKPLEWLRNSPVSKEYGEGWFRGDKGSDDRGNNGGMNTVTGGEKRIGDQRGEEGREGGGARGYSSLSYNDFELALIELREAGIDINHIIDSRSRNPRGSVAGSPLTIEAKGGVAGNAAAPSSSFSSSRHGTERGGRGAALSGRDSGEDGPNETITRLEPITNLEPITRLETITTTQTITTTETTTETIPQPTPTPSPNSGTPTRSGSNPNSGTPTNPLLTNLTGSSNLVDRVRTILDMSRIPRGKSEG